VNRVEHVRDTVDSRARRVVGARMLPVIREKSFFPLGRPPLGEKEHPEGELTEEYVAECGATDAEVAQAVGADSAHAGVEWGSDRSEPQRGRLACSSSLSRPAQMLASMWR
jgi:hypothetical protein